MLLESKLVHVPAQAEMDADWNEHGTLSNKVRASFGEAALEVGTPDRGGNDNKTDAVDTIANILHYLTYEAHTPGSVDVRKVLEGALLHFDAEIAA